MGKIVDISDVILELMPGETPSDAERAVFERAVTGAEGAVTRYLGYNPASLRATEVYPNTNFVTDLMRTVWDVNEAGTVAQITYNSSAPVFNELQVKRLPVRTVHNLWVDIDGRAQKLRFTDDDLKTQASASEGGDFWVNYDVQDSSSNQVCHDGIIRSHGLWPLVAGSVQIDYTAGYTGDELRGVDDAINARPIFDAVLTEVMRRVKKIYANRKQVGAGWTPGAVTGERLGDYSWTGGSGAAGTLSGGTTGATDLLPETIHMLADYVNWGWRIAS